MIAASVREGDDLVDMLLGKEADVNAKSRVSLCLSLLTKGFGECSSRYSHADFIFLRI